MKAPAGTVSALRALSVLWCCVVGVVDSVPGPHGPGRGYVSPPGLKTNMDFIATQARRADTASAGGVSHRSVISLCPQARRADTTIFARLILLSSQNLQALNSPVIDDLRRHSLEVAQGERK